MRRSAARWTSVTRASRPVLLAVSILFQAAPSQGEDLQRDPIPSPLLQLADRAGEQGLEPDARTGHHAGIVEFPRDALLLRVHLIRAARHTIDLQTFIWANDDSSNLLAYELLQASQRGVQIRLLVDSIGVQNVGDHVTFDETTYPNLEIKVYRPAARRIKPGIGRKLIHFILPNGSNQRMHNKMMVVDGVLGITGGRNIGDNYFALSTGYNFKDRELLVAGPQVAVMTRSFDEYWNYKRAYHNHDLKDVAALEEQGVTRPERSRVGAGLDGRFADIDRDALDPVLIQTRFAETMVPVADLVFVSDLPGRKTRFAYFNPHTSSRATHYFRETLAGTQHELLMQSPYVIFNFRTRHMIREHYEDAPDLRVKVSTNSLGAADHLITYAANYRLRTKVVRRLKFEIYEMKPHPAILPEHLPNFDQLLAAAKGQDLDAEPYLCIHAKTYVFDGRVTYIGTFNLDPRSFYYNGECGVFIDDPAFASGVRDTLLREMSAENSWVIARKPWVLGFVNEPLEAVSSLLPIDPWPLRNTSSFELKPGAEEVGPLHPDFYENYEDVGSFPGTDTLDTRRFWISIFKTIGKAATPLL